MRQEDLIHEKKLSRVWIDYYVVLIKLDKFPVLDRGFIFFIKI